MIAFTYTVLLEKTMRQSGLAFAQSPTPSPPSTYGGSPSGCGYPIITAQKIYFVVLTIIATIVVEMVIALLIRVVMSSCV